MVSKEDLITVSVSTLVPSTRVGVDLFCHVPTEKQFALYCDSESELKNVDIARLRSRGIKQLFIRKSQNASYQAYLRDLLDDELSFGASVAARSSALGRVIRDLLGSSFSSARQTDDSVTIAATMGLKTAEIVCHDDFTASDLVRVLHHDYATFTHSTNVGMYAAILASEMGMSRDDISQIATGGLIHDLGKLEIEDRILAKPGKLTDQEFTRIKEHPGIGFRKLVHRTDLTEGQLMMVYQHHEKMDGSGYPVGICGDDIHPWGRLCTVVDVYEALTSNRPYRQPMPQAVAISIMEKESAGFDPEFFECWKQITKTL